MSVRVNTYVCFNFSETTGSTNIKGGMINNHLSVACCISHFIKLPCPTPFCLFFIFFISLLSAAYHSLPLMCVILLGCCKSCAFYYATSCIPSLTPSQCSVAALSYDFTDEVLLTDKASTLRFVAAWLSPLKEYCAPIVRMPGNIALRQESQLVWLYGNLAVD